MAIAIIYCFPSKEKLTTGKPVSRKQHFKEGLADTAALSYLTQNLVLNRLTVSLIAFVNRWTSHFFVWKHLSSQAYWSLRENSGMQIGFSIAQWTRHTAGTDCDTGLCDNANRKFCLENPPNKDSIFQCTSVLGASFKSVLQRSDFQRRGSLYWLQTNWMVPQEYVFFPLRLGSVLGDQTTSQNPAENHSSSLN